MLQPIHFSVVPHSHSPLEAKNNIDYFLPGGIWLALALTIVVISRKIPSTRKPLRLKH